MFSGTKINISEEAARCLLCYDAPCSNACGHGFKPDKAVRAVRFDNAISAASEIKQNVCAECAGECERACIHYDFPVRIWEIIRKLPQSKKCTADLSIEFCGVKCENPFFLSSSIVAANYDMIARAFDAGWGGAVFKTIGKYVVHEVSPRFDAIKKDATPFAGFKNLEQISEHTLEENLEVISRLKKDYPSKVIIASIMGQNEGEWTEIAELCEKAGADMIECNFSCPQMAADGMGSDVGQNPELVKLYTQCVKKNTTIPVLAKMTPNIEDMTVPAIKAVEGGADAIAAINTIKSITAVDLEKMQSLPDINGKSAVSGYSGKAVKPIALRFICDMAKCEKLKGIPLSGMGGIETWQDAAEFIALGCENIQVTTSVMQYGYRIVEDMISGLSEFMVRNGYTRLSELVGKALDNIVPAEKLDRETIVYPVISKEKCIGCGRCYISCQDAGHQAIEFNQERIPKIKGTECAGCQLCSLVCPAGAISRSKRINRRRC